MDNLIQELKQKYKLNVNKISNKRVEFESNNLKFSIFDKDCKILILKEIDGVNEYIWYDIKTLIKIFLNKKVEFI